MTRLRSRSRSRLLGSTNAPPPVLTTWFASASICSSASRSYRRNAASPSSRKISGMVLPVVSSIRRSESTKGMRSRRATFRPSVVLPLQLNPTRTRLSGMILERAVVRERLLEAVAAELRAQCVCQHDRDHRLAHHTRGGDHAHVAALHVAEVALARGVVDRGQR